jgi:hypothetical protein
LTIQVNDICLATNYVVTQLHRGFGLLQTEMLICRARDVIIPNAAANGIENDPLKAMIVLDRPFIFQRLCKLGHHNSSEMQVLHKTIAYHLGISPRTVEIYCANMMEKLRVRSLSEALRIAFIA